MSPPTYEAIRTIDVVGAGTMGHGIAQVFVRSGCSVILNAVALAVERED